MGTTNHGYRYPESTDAADGPLGFKNLALDANARVPVWTASGSPISGASAVGTPLQVSTFRSWISTNQYGSLGVSVVGYSAVWAAFITTFDSALMFEINSGNSASVSFVAFNVRDPAGNLLPNRSVQCNVLIVGAAAT